MQIGLQEILPQSLVCIHDGVRCLVTPELIRYGFERAESLGNAVPCIAVSDSLRMVNGTDNLIIDRSAIKSIQTPQTFYSDILLAAYQQTYSPEFTDDASVVEKMGEHIHLVEGETENIKITRPIDMLIAEKILERRV